MLHKNHEHITSFVFFSSPVWPMTSIWSLQQPLSQSGRLLVLLLYRWCNQWQIMVSQLYRMGNWNSEKLSDLLRVTQQYLANWGPNPYLLAPKGCTFSTVFSCVLCWRGSVLMPCTVSMGSLCLWAFLYGPWPCSYLIHPDVCLIWPGFVLSPLLFFEPFLLTSSPMQLTL